VLTFTQVDWIDVLIKQGAWAHLGRGHGTRHNSQYRCSLYSYTEESGIRKTYWGKVKQIKQKNRRKNIDQYNKSTISTLERKSYNTYNVSKREQGENTFQLIMAGILWMT